MNTLHYPSLPYKQAPEVIQKARLDNIALVPASLLPFKAKYQPLANNLPTGGVLVVPGTLRQQKILEKVSDYFRDHGHQIITMPLEKIARKGVAPRQTAETMKLAF